MKLVKQQGKPVHVLCMLHAVKNNIVYTDISVAPFKCIRRESSI